MYVTGSATLRQGKVIPTFSQTAFWQKGAENCQRSAGLLAALGLGGLCAALVPRAASGALLGSEYSREHRLTSANLSCRHSSRWAKASVYPGTMWG